MRRIESWLLNLQDFVSVIQAMNSNLNQRRHFASDNYAGICPEAWQSLAEANHGHARGYGDDFYTEQAADLIREVFDTACEVFFVFNGTAANSLSLATLCQSYHSIICTETAHIEMDECGAPEFFSNGTKLLLTPSIHGKIDLAAVERVIKKRNDIHFPKPRVLSITQCTELGTVYSIPELSAVGDKARELGLKLHMDGARFANAVAAIDSHPAEISWKAGVDVLCFGGTKNGTHVGDAVVFFNKALAEEFAYRCKQAGQLASKMRFISAPWIGMLKNGVWLKHARHANSMAALLHEQLSGFEELRILFPRQANSVFVELPSGVAQRLWDQGWIFYNFIGSGGCRLMTAWDTTEQDIYKLIGDLKEAILAR